ncbi:hypothetical protein ACFL2Q_01175 [Thermodesulfobacteriota bacterium]
MSGSSLSTGFRLNLAGLSAMALFLLFLVPNSALCQSEFWKWFGKSSYGKCCTLSKIDKLSGRTGYHVVLQLNVPAFVKDHMKGDHIDSKQIRSKMGRYTWDLAESMINDFAAALKVAPRDVRVGISFAGMATTIFIGPDGRLLYTKRMMMRRPLEDETILAIRERSGLDERTVVSTADMARFIRQRYRDYRLELDTRPDFVNFVVDYPRPRISQIDNAKEKIEMTLIPDPIPSTGVGGRGCVLWYHIAGELLNRNGAFVEPLQKSYAWELIRYGDELMDALENYLRTGR